MKNIDYPENCFFSPFWSEDEVRSGEIGWKILHTPWKTPGQAIAFRYFETCRQHYAVIHFAVSDCLPQELGQEVNPDARQPGELLC